MLAPDDIKEETENACNPTKQIKAWSCSCIRLHTETYEALKRVIDAASYSSVNNASERMKF